MSLRVRLILLTVALVTVVVLILSGLYLNSLVDSLSATALDAARLEINVGGQDGLILASSNPSRIGQELARLDNFADWRRRSLYRRLVDLAVRKPDYQVVVP